MVAGRDWRMLGDGIDQSSSLSLPQCRHTVACARVHELLVVWMPAEGESAAGAVGCCRWWPTQVACVGLDVVGTHAAVAPSVPAHRCDGDEGAV